MNATELYALRNRLLETGTLLCFNGPISRSLLEEFGMALKRYLEVDQARSAEAMDVFSVYIEMTQNIRHYVAARGYDEQASAATVVISREASGNYRVSAGNMVALAHGRALIERVAAFSHLDKAALKAAYKTQLRKPRDPANPASAGLGLLEIARRASAPLQATLTEHDESEGFFSLSVVI
ncbi:hypothetical protein IMZ29_16120 [Achromobacter sp. GG226]|uniref:biofilm regulation protein kinase SiaB n=1 Tax=Verticiella alkaliphila TaxID=2779529 RepID=UPI001C0D9A67|nr:biofilm regulation protein kinase SiaB [Verticiella sp. GG226]MBU4612012.1 hypothetical protein [Verticiella sp. GG226]